MGKEYLLALELHDAGVRCIAISRNLREHPLIFKWAYGSVTHGIAQLLGPPRSKGQVILIATLVHPGSLGKVRAFGSDIHHLAIDLYHIGFQLGSKTAAVAPV